MSLPPFQTFQNTCLLPTAYSAVFRGGWMKITRIHFLITFQKKTGHWSTAVSTLGQNRLRCASMWTTLGQRHVLTGVSGKEQI